MVEPRFWQDEEANPPPGPASTRATDRVPGSADDATRSSADGLARAGEEDAKAPECGVVQRQQPRPVFAVQPHDAPRQGGEWMTRELQNEEELTAWQHGNLREMVEEDSQRLKTGEISENEFMVCMKAVEEVEILEYVMQDRRREMPQLRSNGSLCSEPGSANEDCVYG